MSRITPYQVKEWALTPNFDQGLITQAMIESTEARWIVPMLGQDLYDALNSYTKLSGWVDKAIAFLVVYDHMPRLYMRITSTGVQQLQAANTQGSDDKTRAYLADYYLRQANTYLDLIRAEIASMDEYDGDTEVIGYGTGIVL